MRSIAVLHAIATLILFTACASKPGDTGDDDDDPLPLGWSIEVDLAGLDRFAPAAAVRWSIAGTATASEGLAGVDVGGAAAAVTGSGAFTAEAALVPGLNPVSIVARDRAGHARKADRSILSARYLAAGAHNRDAAALVLTDAVVAAMAEGLAAEAGDVDVAAQILAREVLSQDAQCTTWPVEASQGAVAVRLALDGADLWLNIRIPNLYVYFEGRCQGLLSTIPIGGEMGGTIDVWTRLTPAPVAGQDCLTAFGHTAPQVQVGGWSFDVWGLSGPLQSWLVNLFSGSKSAEAREQLRGEIGTQADAMLRDQLADVAVFDRTSPLELLGRPLAMHLCVADLAPAGARLVARIAAGVTGGGTRAAPGAPILDGAVPAAAPGELLLDGNLVAQLLFAAWRDGGLVRAGVAEVDLETLALVAPELSTRYPPGTRVTVDLDGELPAVVRATPGGAGDLTVELGELRLALRVGDDRLFRVGAVLRLELDLVPMDGRLIPIVVSSAAEAVVLDELVDGVDALLETVIANQVAATASGLLSGAALALPALPGLGAPVDVTADAGGRYLRLRMR